MELNLSKIFKVVDIKENSTAGKIPNWVKELNLKIYDRIEVIIDLSSFKSTGHCVKVMNLENGKYTFMVSKTFSQFFNKLIIIE